jgi:SAM-dependent methyltransferase
MCARDWYACAPARAPSHVAGRREQTQQGLASAPVFTDRDVLRHAAYADQAPLAARSAIYRWQRDPIDLPGLAVAALKTVSGDVLDAGCGLGIYVGRLRAERPDLRIVGLDLSAGMRPHVVGDVQALPFADGSISGALAMHMLYHVPDIPLAIRELRRVVEPDGLLLVTTNGRDDKPEIGALFADAVRDLTGTAIDPPDVDGRFTPDDADLLRAEFETVEVSMFQRETLVPEVEPVVAFFDSLRALSGTALPKDVPWHVFLDAVRVRVTAEIARQGSWRLGNQVGFLICR